MPTSARGLMRRRARLRGSDCVSASATGCVFLVSAASVPPGHLAAKLGRLFRSAAARRRGELTYREVTSGIQRAGFAAMSATYVWQLRTGQRANPTMRHLEGLAAFFGVPVAYFFAAEVAARVEADLELIVALTDRSLRQLPLDAAGLSPASLAAVSALVEQLRRLEGSPGRPGRTTAGPDRPGAGRRRRAPGQRGRRTRAATLPD
jgi:transcriptional regulator with XRE-family HTH domain